MFLVKIGVKLIIMHQCIISGLGELVIRALLLTHKGLHLACLNACLDSQAGWYNVKFPTGLNETLSLEMLDWRGVLTPTSSNGMLSLSIRNCNV